MTESAARLFEEINQIKAQWENEVGPSGRKVWPKAIKQRVFQLIEQTVPRKTISKKTGVPYETINVWVHKSQKGRLLPAVNTFHPISVKNELATVTVTDSSQSEIIFKTPKGYEIHGLRASDVLDIIKQLGRL
jgi:transposase-like protein